MGSTTVTETERPLESLKAVSLGATRPLILVKKLGIIRAVSRHGRSCKASLVIKYLQGKSAKK